MQVADFFRSRIDAMINLTYMLRIQVLSKPDNAQLHNKSIDLGPW